ncbi:MAG: response regulator transcription factor [Clostridia bacterium]|nr:response regulator transcription factor [Clostridia bacterium]
MKKILIIDDDKELLASTSKLLKNYSYDVITAADGRTGLTKALSENPDLILLDWMMPEYNGLDFMNDFEKQDNYKTPVIFVTAMGEGINTDNYEVDALNSGAVKYISKPYNAAVLLSSIKSFLRIPKADISDSTGDSQRHIYNDGELIIDHNQKQAFRFDESLKLTSKEFELLAYLEKNAGVVIPREDLLHNVWQYDFFGDVRTVDVTIRRTREKIELIDPNSEENSAQYQNQYKYIKTRRGIGYYFPKQV